MENIDTYFALIDTINCKNSIITVYRHKWYAVSRFNNQKMIKTENKDSIYIYDNHVFETEVALLQYANRNNIEYKAVL